MGDLSVMIGHVSTGFSAAIMLPSGTITFFFTDIEGSTRLWESHPDAMRIALARHDELLRNTIESHGGYVFKTVGDAFCAAFATASEALSAALSAQECLRAEPWKEATAPRVRMAIHTGSAQLRDGDYFGPPLNRVARLLAAGHGGQILLSDVSHDLTRDQLPAQVSLRFLGEWHLKDLARPEPIFQLCHPSLPLDFPPLRTLDDPTLPNNLPQQVTSFIGRENELNEIQRLLTGTRVLTLTGSGGAGKTRLALQTAAEALDATTYPDGVWLVELAPLADAGLAADATIDVLSIPRIPGDSRPALTALIDSLRNKRLLLLLDNAEHVLTGAASLTDAVLRACPGVKVLVTSREALNIAGETAYRVPSLSLPAPGEATRTATPESLSQFEAVRLFIDRARAALPSFVVTNANAPTVASICQRLDGIPLALELAAARVRALPAEEINRRLDDRFRLLTGGSRSALPRQQTLRAAVEWSYNLLTESERLTLRRLSVFAGGLTLDAAEQVASGGSIEDWEVLDLITSLVDKSLVVFDQKAEPPRYRLLETVRQYARERLVDAEEDAVTTRDRHLFWMLTLTKAITDDNALEALESETDNIRTAMEWGTASLRSDPLVPLELLERLVDIGWTLSGRLAEAREWARRLVDRFASPEHVAERANALRYEAGLAWYQGNVEEARPLMEEAVCLEEALGNSERAQRSRLHLGVAYLCAADYEAARPIFEQNMVRLAEHDQGEWHRFQVATNLYRLGRVQYGTGAIDEAARLFHESLTLFLLDDGRFEDRYAVPRALFLTRLCLAHIARVRRQWQEAAEQWLVTVSFLEVCPESRLVAMGIEGIALLAYARNEHEMAIRLWGAADRLREQSGSRPHADEEQEQVPARGAIEAAMGAETFEKVWSQGQVLDRAAGLRAAITFLETVSGEFQDA